MNEGLEKHIPQWLKIGIRELEFHEKYKMTDEELRDYYIERIMSSNRIIPTIDLLNQDGKWYGRRDLNDSGFDGFDFSYFMTTYLISHNIDIESLLDNPQQLKQVESNLVQNTINYYNGIFKINEIKDNFDDIDTPNELMDFMNKNINYGYVDDDGNKHYDNLTGIRGSYKIKSKEITLNSKVGNCIDQAKLQKAFFDKKGIENKLFCIQYKEQSSPDKIKIHPITIYKENGKWYHFEHAFYNFKGIHEYSNIEDLSETFINKYFGNTLNPEIKEIGDLPENITIDEFTQYVKEYVPETNKIK